MQSISGILTQTQVTTGQTPPPLVGSSISVVDDLVFVFAGRLVTSRKMTNHLYVLNLNTHVWTRHIAPPDSDKAPKPRYFHSTNIHRRSLVVFGGMGYSRQSADGLCVLDDVTVFDVDTMSWRQPLIQPSLFVPRPRYAHLATISDHQLFVIGGQDMNNGYLPEINVLNLDTFEWVQAITLEQHVGAYRSVAVAMPVGTDLPIPMKNKAEGHLDDPKNGDPSSNESTSSTPARNRMSILYTDLDYSPPTDTPGPIFMYSNYNFADVKRELQLLSRQSQSGTPVGLEDISDQMTGTAMPPGLRFPTGDALGQYIIISGTCLSPQSQSYSVWGLNTSTLVWTRLDTGNIFATGSWNRGVLHSKSNRYLVFGNNNRNLLEDYNHRQVNFEHMASVDLEAFGIYRPPKMTCSPLAQEMGLRLLNEPTVADFYVVTRESQEIPVNSAVLRHRWPYFSKLLKDADTNTNSSPISKRQQNYGLNENGLCDILEDIGETADDDENKLRADISYNTSARCMVFPYAYPVVVALLQYLYTDNLLTAQQYQPHILSQLLLLADMYDMPRLISLSTHALHQMLNMSTAPLIFETAALSHQTSLQIRALKLMIAAKKMINQQQQLQQRFSHYNTDVKDWDSASMTSNSFQQNYVDHHQPSPTPTASVSLPYYSISTPSEPDLKTSQHMPPTLGAYRPRTPSVGNRSMLHSVTNGTLPALNSNYPSPAPGSIRQINTSPGNRPSTSMKSHGSSRHTTNDINYNNSAESTTPLSTSSSYYSEPSRPTFLFNAGNNIPASTIPEDDTLSMSSFSAYGNHTSISSSSSSSKDNTTHQRKRKENRFLNALGNKFMSRS